MLRSSDMPTSVLPPKRVLGDSTKAHRNISNIPSPSAAKKRKLDGVPSLASTKSKAPNGNKFGPGSSQPKSQFEEEVLEKLTQDINGLKQKNSEKDQQWERPNLDAFDEERDSLCFQQIEVEEGTLHGGKTAIKLFGVTEVSICCHVHGILAHMIYQIEWELGASSCNRLSTLPLCRCSNFV